MNMKVYCLYFFSCQRQCLLVEIRYIGASIISIPILNLRNYQMFDFEFPNFKITIKVSSKILKPTT